MDIETSSIREPTNNGGQLFVARCVFQEIVKLLSCLLVVVVRLADGCDASSGSYWKTFAML
jgi:hypothetical protein